MGRIRSALAVFALVLSIHIARAPQAGAFVCNGNEEAYWVGAYNGVTQITSAAAMQTDIYVRNSALNASCGCDFYSCSARHSAAHMDSRDYVYMAETIEDNFPLPGNNVGFEMRWEAGVGNDPAGGPDIGFGTAVGCCVWATLKVLNVANANKWQFFFDWNRTGSWTQIGPSGGYDIGVARGVPSGESGRHPDNDGTDAYDHHVNAKYAVTNCGCSWTSFPSNHVIYGSISTYHWNSLAADNWTITHN